MYFPIARIWLRRNYKAAGPDNIPSQALDYGIPVHYGTFSLYSLFFKMKNSRYSVTGKQDTLHKNTECASHETGEGYQLMLDFVSGSDLRCHS